MKTRRLYAPFDAITVDPFSDEFETWVDVMNRCMIEEWGEYAHHTELEALRAAAEEEDYGQVYYMVRVGSRPAGVGLLEFPRAEAEIRPAFGTVRVLKAVQGYGVGQTLIAALEDAALEMGCALMETMTAARSYRDDRITRIVRRAGYDDTKLMLRQDAERAHLEAAGSSIAAPGGFTFRHHVDEVPDDIVDDLAVMAKEMSVEREEPEAAETITAEYVRARLIHPRSDHDQLHLMVAIHEASGKVAGAAFSEITTTSRKCEIAWNYVRVPYRQLGVHELMVAELLRRCLETSPHLTRVRSFLPATEIDSVEANRAAGFRDTAYYREWMKDLRPEPARTPLA